MSILRYIYKFQVQLALKVIIFTSLKESNGQNIEEGMWQVGIFQFFTK